MRFVGKLVSFILTALFFITMYLVYRLNILPLKYYSVVVGVLLLIILFLDLKLISRRTSFSSRVFFIFVSILFSAGIIYLLTYIDATYDFMKNMVYDKFETVTYDVIVDKKSSYNKIKDLSNSNIGYMNDDKRYTAIKFFIRKDINYKEKSYKSINSLINSLDNNETDSILLEDSYYELLKEEYDYLKDSTKVIKKYKLIDKKRKKNKYKLSKDKPFIVYISGIDTYGKISSVSRSDVNIVAVVNPHTEKILLISIPRDYYVQLHGTTGDKDKLTHAGIYGIDMSVKTIEDLLDIDINFYVRLNFSTLTKSIDLLNGVDVYSDMTFNPTAKRSITIKQGMNHMDGETALAFARERYQYRTGDRHRGQNQQAILTAVIKKVSTPSIITKYKDLLKSLDGTFETSMSYEDITNLVKIQLDKNIDWNIESISLDGTGSRRNTYSMGQRSLYVMVPDEQSIKDAKAKIKTINK